MMENRIGTAGIAMVTIELDNEFIWYAMGDKYKTPKSTSMGTYGTHRGLTRILDALDEWGVKATFFIPGVAIEKYSEKIMEIDKRGHEIALHGYAHENFHDLTEKEQGMKIRKGKQGLEDLIGKEVRGFRLPEGECTWETMRILREEGIGYDSSLFDQDLPYLTDEKLVEIPMRWELQDFPYFAYGPGFPVGEPRIACYDEVLDNWLRELKAAYELKLCYVIKFDPQTIGSPGRMFLFEQILRELKEKNMWIATGSELEKYVREAKMV